MKTKTEIEEKIKKLEWQGNNEGTNEIIRIGCGFMVASLEWVLKEPKYKRTIFELTDDEIKELVGILNKKLNLENIHITKNKSFPYLLVSSEDWEIGLCEDFDILTHKGFVANSAKYIDTVRNMLSQEKPI